MHRQQTGPTGLPYQELICRECSSPLIQVIEWTRLSDNHWSVLVRCPECFLSCEMVTDDDGVHDFLLERDDATRSLLEAADALDRDLFRRTCESFTRALRADRICPMDF